MYSYVASVGKVVCVCCCVFLYNTIRAITSAVITDKNTNRISRIVTERIITMVEGVSCSVGRNAR